MDRLGLGLGLGLGLRPRVGDHTSLSEQAADFHDLRTGKGSPHFCPPSSSWIRSCQDNKESMMKRREFLVESGVVGLLPLAAATAEGYQPGGRDYLELRTYHIESEK